MKRLAEPIEFEWDKGNIGKPKQHNVEQREVEEAFFDKQTVIYSDVFHSREENRYILLGKTKSNRLLYIVFTYRKTKLRVISARDINKKEVCFYEKTA
ncbi:BrnT family toxin [Candidatus Gottesmanbacteria bacterium]|nr:BrnT family toxin [Candidatus Gottesmanbacteria bacterium]